MTIRSKPLTVAALEGAIREGDKITGAYPCGSGRVVHVFKRPLASEAHLTIAAQKPWEELGMSRRTWYRRKKEGKL